MSDDRVLRLALAGSIVLHLILGLIFVAFSSEARRLVPHVASPRHTPSPDEVVTISSAPRLERRARVARSGRAQPVAVRRPVPPRPRSAPARQPERIAQHQPPAVVARPVQPAYTPPPLLKHELARLAPQAKPQPPRTIPSVAPAKPVPLRQSVRTVARAALAPSESHQAGAELSAREIAKIDRDLSRTLAQARSEPNPLSNSARKAVAAATKRYSVDFSGLAGQLRGYQGVCYPIKSWQSGGFNYYYVSCRTEHVGGSVREEAVPWPVHFAPSADPFDGSLPAADQLPLQLPPAGWRPDPNAPSMDPDLAEYLRKNGYSF